MSGGRTLDIAKPRHQHIDRTGALANRSLSRGIELDMGSGIHNELRALVEHDGSQRNRSCRSEIHVGHFQIDLTGCKGSSRDLGRQGDRTD